MDSSKYHILYASRRAKKDAVLRAVADSGASFDAEVAGLEAGGLGADLEALRKYGDVHLCATGTSCLSKLFQLHESSSTNLKPTVVLIDTPHDEPVPASRPRSRSMSPRSNSPLSEPDINVPDDEVYGLKLLQRVNTEAHLRKLSKLVVLVSVISRPSMAESDDPSAPTSSPFDARTVDPSLLRRCIDLGAADVIVSPINSKCMTSVGVQAYKAHRDAIQEKNAMLEVRQGRKMSWVGVAEEKPFAYLRESMVSGLMKEICRLGENRIRHFKVVVSTERQEAIAAAIGDWHFCAHDFTNDELVVAAMLIFKHALDMPALEKWRIPTGQLIDFLSACRVGYNSFVPYHNFRHVVDVLQATFHFLVSLGTFSPYPAAAGVTAGHAPPKSQIASLLGPADGLTMLITAIGHDVGHPGVNNAFLVNLNAPLAQLYNDRSVLESFHCAAYSQILRRHWPSVFEDSKMRKLMISSILSTDMGLHFDYMKELSDSQFKLSEDGTTDGWDERTVEEQSTLVCSLLIKCADISNVARHHSTASQWMYTLADETSRQASMESKLGMTSSLMSPPKKDLVSLSKGQIGFMNLFALPLFQGVADMMPALRYTVEEIEINRGLFEAGMQEEQAAKDSLQCQEAAADPEANQTPETTIMTTPAAAAVVGDGDEGEIAVSPLDRESPLERSYFTEATMKPSPADSESDLAPTPPTDPHQDVRCVAVGAGGGFDPVADFAASDPFNMRYRLDSYDHGKPLSIGKQRCSETTDGSNSAPYSGDWTSQATSATTGKMPLSPSTQGTSVGSRESLERPASKAFTAPTPVPGAVPQIRVPAGEGGEEEAEMQRLSSAEESVSGGSLGKEGQSLRKKPSRFRMNALNLFRRNKTPGSGAVTAGAENTFR